MSRNFIPVEQRSTRNLELAFDRLTSNKLVADAIEAFQIMHELARREAIRLRQTPANEGTGPSSSLQLVTSSPQPGAGVPADPAAPTNGGSDETPHQP